jgi:hypothetical protein
MVTSRQHPLPKWFLEAAAQHQQPPENLGSVASTFLGTLYSASDWSLVQRELEQLSWDNGIEGILRRQEEALLGITNSFRRDAPDPAKIAAIQKAREDAERSLGAELEAAEEEFRARVAEIAAHLPEVAKAAEKTPADSAVAQAAARIARIVSHAHLSRLGPYWMLIVLYWMIVHLTVGDLAALTLWYMVLSDYFKKQQSK